MRARRQWLIGCLVLATWGLGRDAAVLSADKPNIIFILADDLGYGDLGCYGQKLIQTPRLDRMAAEGIQFRNMYAGCAVCAPSRSVLMTGQHMGHTHVRGNAGGEDMASQTLRDEDVTVAELLQRAGYATALCGKWGLGDEAPGGLSGLPTVQGFDEFFGYLNQVHAHNYFPEFLWRGRTKVPLPNEVVTSEGRYGGFVGGHATRRVAYSHDLILDEALSFVERSQSGPFFLYLALTIPHANNEGTRATGNGQEIPDYGEYAATDWTDPDKGQAAMITHMDRGIGQLLDRLRALNLEERTLVLFSSDNGPHEEGGQNPERFTPAGPLRGMKRDLYEGGIRVPFLAWWPGTSPEGTVSDHIGYFGDFMATAAELAGVEVPPHTDSISFVPSLTGHSERQQQHEYLYWEFYERGGRQAVRSQNWKAVRMPLLTGPTELFDLSTDLGEAHNVADQHPDVVRKLTGYMEAAHIPHPNWTARGARETDPPPPGDGRPRF
jgi:uncharacterized sulfatase